MEEVKIADLRVGDRIWGRGWAHPYSVVVADVDAKGPWVMIRRWDGMPIRRKFYAMPFKIHRLDPGATCPHCGGTQ